MILRYLYTLRWIDYLYLGLTLTFTEHNLLQRAILQSKGLCLHLQLFMILLLALFSWELYCISLWRQLLASYAFLLLRESEFTGWWRFALTRYWWSSWTGWWSQYSCLWRRSTVEIWSIPPANTYLHRGFWLLFLWL